MAGTFFKQGRLVSSTATTATAAGTTVLTASSEMNQQFTGTTTQQVNLPDGSTLQVGAGFTIMNRSTGVVTVKYNDGTTTAATLEPNTQRTFVVIVASAGNGTWDISTGGGDSVASSSFGINYLSDNPDAETDTTGWATYADAAGARPVNGTGGSPTVTWTRSTSSPLRDTASFLFTKDAANRQGEGVSFDITLDSADLAKPTGIFFDMTVVSGTYADGDLVVEWIDDAGGTPVPNQPAPTTILSVVAGTSQPWRGYVQTHATSTSGRLCIHVASTSASAYVLKFDNFVVGPTFQSYGAVVTDWVAWTPTGSWSTNTTYTGYKRRVGDCAEYMVKVATSGAPTSASLTVNLPSGEIVDTTKLVISTTNRNVFGQVATDDAGVAVYTGQVAYSSTTAVSLFSFDGANPTAVLAISEVSPITFGSGDSVTALFRVPIVGWSSNVLVSSDADTRVCAARATSTVGQSINNNAYTTVDLNATTFDTHGGISLASNTYTIPIPGKYRVSGKVMFTSGGGWAAGEQATLKLVKNGSTDIAILHENFQQAAHTTYVDTGGTTTCDLIAGDTIELQIYQNSGAALTIHTDANSVYLDIQRISGPAQIAASEKIFLLYTNNAGTVLTANTTNIDWSTKVQDSHGAWNGTTFTAPRAGMYFVTGLFKTTVSGTVNGQSYVNGSASRYYSGEPSNNTIHPVSFQTYLTAGDTLTFRSDNGLTLSNSAIQHWIAISSQG